MCPYDRTGDGETESHAARVGVARAFTPVEWLENLLTPRNTLPFVFHGDDDAFASGIRLTAALVLYGIPESRLPISSCSTRPTPSSSRLRVCGRAAAQGTLTFPAHRNMRRFWISRWRSQRMSRSSDCPVIDGPLIMHATAASVQSWMCSISPQPPAMDSAAPRDGMTRTGEHSGEAMPGPFGTFLEEAIRSCPDRRAAAGMDHPDEARGIVLRSLFCRSPHEGNGASVYRARPGRRLVADPGTAPDAV
jgi:hypothetical protein